MPQLVRLCTGYGDAIHFGVVADQSSATAAQANIELEAMAAMLKGEVERGKSILWNGASGTGAPMPEQEREIGHLAPILLWLSMRIRTPAVQNND
jgi:hypothetical protein